MRPDIWRWLVAVWLLAMAGGAWAGPATVPSDCTISEALPTGRVSVFRDASASMTPGQILQLPADAFQSVIPGHYLGNGNGVWWLRFTLHNTGERPCERWLAVAPSRIGDVHVYLPGDTGWERMVAGTSYPFREWALPERQPLFPLYLRPDTTTVLAKVASKGQTFALTPRLWSPEQFLRNLNRQSLTDGLIGGAIVLLVLISLVLSYLYRRPPLLYMALATGLYIIHVALLRNYLFVYFWPDWPTFNHWARLSVMGFHFVAFFAYLYTVVRVDRLHRQVARIFYGALVAFALLAVFGASFSNTSYYSYSIIALYQGFIWLLAVAVVYNLISGRDRRWFPPVLIGAICLRGVVLFGQLVGLNVKFWGAEYLSAPMMLILGVFLLGTLLSQVRKGRLAEMQARAALDRQHATENKRLERTVAQRTAELDRGLQARRQLLGRIGHDLRSPLIGILDSVRQWHAGDSRHDYPELIERNVRQQMDMIDQLLEFSRTELSELTPQPVPGYLYSFLNEVAEQAGLAVEQNGNRLQRVFAADLPALVCIDFHYLRRVLSNLLGNANKYTQRGTIRFSVATLPTADAETLRLYFIIDDNGPGISAADRERMLQPYARGANAARAEGHGLGLAIVTQLLERLGAQLTIGDAPGGGSRFRFELAAAPAAESDLEPIIEVGETVAIEGAGRVILVVDDEPQQRDIICDLLDSYGFDSIAAADGQAALDFLHTRGVDLVLTDQYMAGTDGWVLLQVVRKQWPGLPVLLYSSVPPQRPAPVDAGFAFDGALLKPTSGALMLREIDRLTRQIQAAVTVNS